MRNSIKFLVFLFSAFGLHLQVSAALDLDCSSTGSLDGVANPYGNIYHSGTPDSSVANVLSNCYWSLSYLKFLGTHSGEVSSVPEGFYDFRVRHVFPVYSRISDKPFLVQGVTFVGGKYSGMSSRPARMYEQPGIKDDCKDTRLPDRWVNPSPCPYSGKIENDDRRNVVLLLSTEPYATAPMVQFYSYHNKLLMVARDERGEVYRFAYEDSVHRISSKTVKAFLGDKWFRP